MKSPVCPAIQSLTSLALYMLYKNQHSISGVATKAAIDLRNGKQYQNEHRPDTFKQTPAVPVLHHSSNSRDSGSPGSVLP